MDIFEAIQNNLKEIESEYGVRILYAVESGSRAWGVASPDSDYDVRFVYVRPTMDYIRLDEPRDVIEWKLDEVLDINGWDIRKTMKQFSRGNAVLFEWSHSPIIYKTTDEWNYIRDVGRNYFSVRTAIRHYFGTATTAWNRHLLGDTVRYKHYFRFHAIP